MKFSVKHIKNVTILTFLFLNCGYLTDISAQVQKHERLLVDKSLKTKDKIKKSDVEWKKQLSAEQYELTRNNGEETEFSGKFHDHWERGIYYCVNCGNALFTSDKKYDSGKGWPSFTEPVFKQNIKTKIDKSGGQMREAVLCARCDAMLGHVYNDGPKPTKMRYCMNSGALKFEKK